MRKYSWIVDVARQRTTNILHPYMVEIYVARDGSEAYLSLAASKAFYAQNGVAREGRLELAFSWYEVYEDN
jgi:hypothetical protein